MKPILLLAGLCFFAGLATGSMAEHHFNPPDVYSCEVLDYQKIEEILTRQVSAQPLQPLDIEKIKHVKSFTYAPVLQVHDTCCQ